MDIRRARRCFGFAQLHPDLPLAVFVAHDHLRLNSPTARRIPARVLTWHGRLAPHHRLAVTNPRISA
jgi:hypothetical protein